MIEIVKSLLDDCLISQQGLCVREYVELKTFEYGINNLPITNEWRFFFYGENLLSYGYYWSFASNKPKEIDPRAISLAKEIASIVKNKINFFVIDVAETKDGDWILIELNDGQMSGLSDNDPHVLYSSIGRI